jgi:cytochrome c oxidase assembly protein subunit 11
MSEMDHINRRNMRVLAMCLGALLFMSGLTAASVPLYRLFCQVTGYGGTTQVAGAGPETILDREVTVRFDTNVAGGLAWDFEASQLSQTLRIGEVGLAFFTATNETDVETHGVATFNVTPLEVGQFFNKIQCFCFNEQTLAPGETAQMPVYYYVDPAIAERANLDDVTTITLSYTFFPSVTPQANAGRAGEGVRDVAINTNLGHTEP